MFLVGTHSLYSAVHHFDTLHKINDIHHRVRRDTQANPQNNPTIVQFNTLGRYVEQNGNGNDCGMRYCRIGNSME